MDRESEAYKPIVDALNKMGWMAWRNNTGKRGGVSFGKKGSADVLCVTPPAAMLWGIEVKRPGGKLSEDQKAFRRDLIAMGGILLVLDAPDKIGGVIVEVMLPYVQRMRRRLGLGGPNSIN